MPSCPGPESEFVGHEACGACGSSDALGRYSDGHAYCHKCGTFVPAEGNTPRTNRRTVVSGDYLEGEYRELPKRGLAEETCRKFGYHVARDHSGKTVQVADYRNDEGEIVAQKLRDADKNFKMLKGGKTTPLFGQHIWRSGGRRVVVTEGELDAMSVAQAFNLSWPVVSIPNGAAGAKKSLQAALEWLEGYEQVVLCFDMDEDGRRAAADCALLFTPGKVHIVELPLKDANAMLTAGRADELRQAVWNARVYRPDGIVGLDEIAGRVLADVSVGRPWFLPSLTTATFGRRSGEVIGLGAGTGVGKTDFFTQSIAYDVTELGLNVGVLFLEQAVGETGRRIAGKIGARRFHVPDGTWTQDELHAAWGKLRSTGRLHLYDNWGAMDWPTIRSRIRYMVLSLGCQHIYLDHMTALAAAEDDERKALERIMAEAAGDATAHGHVLHYVSHLATPEGKPHEEGGRVMIRHFKGSRALGFWSHFMFGLERDQQGGDPATRSRTTLRCLKDRYTGQATGQTWGLAYDASTGLLSGAPEESGDFADETGDDPPF